MIINSPSVEFDNVYSLPIELLYQNVKLVFHFPRLFFFFLDRILFPVPKFYLKSSMCYNQFNLLGSFIKFIDR